MLARSLKSIEAAVSFAVNKGSIVAVDTKYDGERTIMYYNRNAGNKLRLISRNNKDQTEIYPGLDQ